jgi:transposase
MRGSRQRCSMASCIAYRVDGSDARLLFDVQRASFNSASLIGALSNLSMELDEPITLVWDNLRAHHSEDKGTLAFINESPWLTVHRLPAYAPDLNPVEGVWSALKGSDLANLCAADRAELERAARNGLQRITENQAILWGCLRHTGLELNRRDSTDKAQ